MVPQYKEPAVAVSNRANLPYRESGLSESTFRQRTRTQQETRCPVSQLVFA